MKSAWVQAKELGTHRSVDELQVSDTLVKVWNEMGRETRSVEAAARDPAKPRGTSQSNPRLKPRDHAAVACSRQGPKRRREVSPDAAVKAEEDYLTALMQAWLRAYAASPLRPTALATSRGRHLLRELHLAGREDVATQVSQLCKKLVPDAHALHVVFFL
ncbi:MAG: hypothetical protein MMC23_010187, partial [Stictis urceolatum]|nr:hypothetical protein [Stictis urceolata]